MWWLATALASELSGTLTGAAGEPVVGATVYAYDSRFNYASAQTRSGGEWSITGLSADRYRLRFLPPNYDPHGDRFFGGAWSACDSDPVELSEGVSALADLDESLAVGAAVSGRVTDLGGNPIPGMRVSLYGAEDRTSLIIRGDNSDEDGGFSIVGLDADATASRFYLVVAGDGWPEQWLGGQYEEGAGEVLALRAGESGTVGDVALLDGIRLSGVISGPAGPVTSGTAYAYASSQVLGVTIGADGRYVADGLPPGDVVTWASSPGHATTYYPDADRPGGTLSVPDEGDDVTIDLYLPEDSTLTFHATGEGDIASTSVLLYNDTYSVGRGDQFDASDKVVLPGLWPGDYTLYVSGSSGGFVSGFMGDESGERTLYEVDGDTVIDVVLTPAATLSGTVIDDDGAPVYGATVLVTEDSGEARTWSSSSGRDGAWTVSGVAAATVSVGVSYAWYCAVDPGWAPMWIDASRTDAGAGLFSLSVGEAVSGVDLVLPRDDDHDSMGDRWEEANGLDSERDDGAEDADGDGFTNAVEWQLDTDPTDARVAGECGQPGCAAGVGLLPVAVLAVVSRRRRPR